MIHQLWDIPDMPNALRFKSVLLLFYSNTKCSILRPVHRKKNSCSGLGSRMVAAQTETPIPAIPGSAYSWSYAAPPVWLMVIKLRRICLLGTRFAQIDSRQIGGPSLPVPPPPPSILYQCFDDQIFSRCLRSTKRWHVSAGQQWKR